MYIFPVPGGEHYTTDSFGGVAETMVRDSATPAEVIAALQGAAESDEDADTESTPTPVRKTSRILLCFALFW